MTLPSVHARLIEAIQALAQERFLDAHRLVLDLLADTDGQPLRRGRCRYCHCSEGYSCAVMVTPPGFDPTIVRCTWADEERTVCTNVRCLERHTREQPERLARLVVLP